MRDYAKVAPTFWTGETGKQIRKLGRDAQVVALYLITCPNSNWIGLYYLPLPVLCHEVGITRANAVKVLRKLQEIDFAHYCESREEVFVPGTARFQVSAQLKEGDKRIKGIMKDLQPHLETPFGMNFYQRYREAFLLPEIPIDDLAVRYPLEAPSKPVTESEAVSEAVSESETEEIGALRPLPAEAEAEGPKSEKKESVEAPNAKTKPGPEVLFDIYDHENKRLPQVKARSRERMAKCRSRINQAVSSGCLEQYLTDFRAAVSKAQSTPFLCGDNERGWRAEFDWFIANQTNPYRVLEGKYDSKGGGGNGRHKGNSQPRERNPHSGPRYDPEKLFQD